MPRLCNSSAIPRTVVIPRARMPEGRCVLNCVSLDLRNGVGVALASVTAYVAAGFAYRFVIKSTSGATSYAVRNFAGQSYDVR